MHFFFFLKINPRALNWKDMLWQPLLDFRSNNQWVQLNVRQGSLIKDCGWRAVSEASINHCPLKTDVVALLFFEGLKQKFILLHSCFSWLCFNYRPWLKVQKEEQAEPGPQTSSVQSPSAVFAIVAPFGNWLSLVGLQLRCRILNSGGSQAYFWIPTERETQRKAKGFKDQKKKKKKALILYQFSKRSLEGNNFLLWYNWHITLYQFQLYNIRIQYLYTLWNEHHSRSCYSTVTKFFPSNESFKRSILQNFQIYNAELLTIVTMLYLYPRDVFLTVSLYLLTLFTHVSHLPRPCLWQPLVGSLHLYNRFCYFRFHVFLWRISLSITPSRFIRAVVKAKTSFCFIPE